MRFSRPLVAARLIRRYKRFLADVELADGAEVTAHCANPGSLIGLAVPGAETWLSHATNPERKLRYTVELLGAAGGLVGVNTSLPNRLAAEAVAAGRIPELAGYAESRREVRYGENSRIDLLLENADRPPCYVEIKSVTLKRDNALPGTAEFPDAVTARGAKHLRELAAVAVAGDRAVMLFVAQRGDCERLAIAEDIDPVYAESLRAAVDAGVETLCYACNVSPQAIELARPLPLAL